MNNNIKQQSINDRIYARNIPSTLLEPSLPSRPVNTKYVHLNEPVIPPLHTIGLDGINNKYNDNEIFNPGNRPGPWVGFSSNVDVESTLRDQLHRTNCKSTYSPNYKSSDMYNVTISPNNNNLNINEFPYLFSTIPSCATVTNPTTETFTSQSPNTFNTCTRLTR